MKNIINWIKGLLKKKPNSSEIPNSSSTPPMQPIPEIPTKEEVENFPHRSIPDFKFVDSSHHHPDFDVKAYAKECRLLLNKTTQGLVMIDSTHSKRKKLCQENGITYGGYHFFECKKSWRDQLDHYLKCHGPFSVGPIIDFETWDGHQSMDDLKKEIENLWLMLIEAERLTGKTAIIYAGYHVLVALQLPKKFSRFIFWVPRYASAIGKLPSPCTEGNLMAWQFTESGSFPGFKGGNDVNIYYGKANLLNL